MSNESTISDKKRAHLISFRLMTINERPGRDSVDASLSVLERSENDSARTVSVSQPFSTFFCFASLNVLVNILLSCAAGGPGREFGLRKVSRCLTAGGRCLTTIVNDDFGRVTPAQILLDSCTN